MKFLPSLCLALLAPVVLAAAESDTLAALLAADDARIAAMQNPTEEGLAKVFSADLRYAHSSGSVDTRGSFIDSLVSGRTKYVTYQPVERDFTLASPGIALMHGKAKIRVASAKGEADLHLSYLAVWREEGGSWKFFAWQSCRLPQEEKKP